MSEENLDKKEAAKWKKEIFAIEDSAMLDYICTLCDARRSVARADGMLEEKDEKENEGGPYAGYHAVPAKMAPLFPTETDPEEVI